MRDRLIVFTKNQKRRKGRGFSRNELKKAGLSVRQAYLQGLPIDSRRRTSHTENVKLIQQHFKTKNHPRKG